jgi:hypothetical protein
MVYPETERPILDRALDAMARETGLAAKVLRWEPLGLNTRRPDALIEVTGPQQLLQFAVEVKNVDRFEILNHVRAFWPPNATPPLLLVAPYITPQVAERCRNMDICFADTAGNVYLRAPGLHIYVTGKQKPLELKMARGGRITNPAGLKVAFALLCEPRLLNATYREIATTAGVALGTVGPVIKDLENRKHVTPALDDGPMMRRRFLDPQRLLKEWVALYPTVLRPKLNVRRFRAPRPAWTEGLNLNPYRAFWGGEVAANRLLHYLQPQAITIYTGEAPTQLIVDHRLKADINGDTEILDVFWNTEHLQASGDVVPPILAYTDLMTTTDGRDLEAANMIYDKYIGAAFRNQA